MARSRNPVLAVVSMALLVAFVTAVVRFAYLAYLIVQAGESLRSVPVRVLLMDVMGLHWFALYGAVAGGLFGAVLVLVDKLRYQGREEELSWSPRGEIKPFADDAVKARRMEMGERYSEGGESGDRDRNKG
jgi:hypothetical protein